MSHTILGLHHVAAIADDPQRNLDFYVGVLGLHLVKITVDGDDPLVYQLSYGDAAGRPGSLLTFSCWPGAVHGAPGPGQVVRTALAVPAGTLDAWRDHLRAHGVAVDAGAAGGAAEVCTFSDPDGLALALVAEPAVVARPRASRRPMPVGHAITGLAGMTIEVREPAPTEDFLTAVLGARVAPEADLPERRSYLLGRAGPGARVAVRVGHEARSGLIAAGSVRHVAFRVPDEEALTAWRDRLVGHADAVGPVRDHVYYRSITLREPSGVRVDLATDGPGVTVDEAAGVLGMRLTLPPVLEERRAQIIRMLPPLHRPQARGLETGWPPRGPAP